MDTDQLTLQTLLHLGYAADERRHLLPDAVRRAVWALLACRTAVLGGHVHACPEGHVERIWSNSCRHRRCPPWAWVQVERWLAQQQARLLACDHDPGIFTLPHERNELWLANVDGMSGWLFARVHDTLVERLGDRQDLEARPGIIATLHTWSQTRRRHPHLHCLVTGGGRHATSQWVAVRHGLLRPRRVVMALFRGQLSAAIRQGIGRGTLQLPPGTRQQPVDHRLHQLGRQQWNVRLQERDPAGQGGLIDWARDLRGGPLSNRRLRACDGQPGVCADQERAKGPEGQAKVRTMRWPLAQVLGRWLRQVPPTGAVWVRGWGLEAHRPRRRAGPGPAAGGPRAGGGTRGCGWAARGGGRG